MKEQVTVENFLQNYSSAPWGCWSPVYITQLNNIQLLKLLTLAPVMISQGMTPSPCAGVTSFLQMRAGDTDLKLAKLASQ